MKAVWSFVSSFRFVLLGAVFQPFGIDRAHHGAENAKLGTDDPMIPCVGAESLIGDRSFAAHCAVEAIEAQRFPRIPIKLVPGTRIEFDVWTGSRLEPFDIGLRGGKLIEPVLNICGSAFAR
jgi:hypothetical protein